MTISTSSILEINQNNIFDLSFVREFARISDEKDDNLISYFIHVACKSAKDYLKMDILKTKRRAIIKNNQSNVVRLPFAPSNEIIQVKSTNLIDKKFYQLSLNGKEIEFNDLLLIDFEIDYSTGFDHFNQIPENISYSILNHITSMYEYRITSLPESSKDIYNRLRDISL